jgi:hypothetical protein
MVAAVSLERRLFWVFLWVLAMAAMEAAVVVYLRELFCPEGVLFPVLDVSGDARLMRIRLTELLRELATLGMLAAVAALAGETPWQRWAVFMLLFGLWDLLYYGWLYVLLGWPASLMAWDVLFLLPVTWTGPVLAPCLVSIALVGAAAAILRGEGDGVLRAFRGVDWALEAVAGLTVILAFVSNWSLCQFRPEARLRFPWLVFGTGLALGVAVFVGALRRGLRHHADSPTDS